MASMNKVFVAGNLTRDPEVRYTPSGSAVADLSMAINRVYTSGSGEQKEETCFVSVVVWGKQAELCGEYLSKGSPVLVEGSLQFDQWQTDSGEKRSRLRVKADRVQFLGRPRKGEFGDAPQGAGQAPQGAGPAAPAADRAGPRDDSAHGVAQDEKDDLPF
jgi:single-strand DNA-binding protein